MTKEIWLLGGSAGCYDSHHEWVVAAFEIKAAADAEAAALNSEILEYGGSSIDRDDRERVIQHFKDAGRIDGAIQTYSSLEDVQFVVWKVPLVCRTK